MCAALSESRLVVMKKGSDQLIFLPSKEKTSISVGSDIRCDLRIVHDDISATHFKIYRDSHGKIKIANLNVTNPVMVNDEVVKGKIFLNSGDIIKLLGNELRWESKADYKRKASLLTLSEKKKMSGSCIKTKRRITIHSNLGSAPTLKTVAENTAEDKNKEEESPPKLEVSINKENGSSSVNREMLNLSGTLITSYSPVKSSPRRIRTPVSSTPERSSTPVKNILKESLSNSSTDADTPRSKIKKSMYLIDFTTPAPNNYASPTKTGSSTPSPSKKTTASRTERTLLRSVLKQSAMKSVNEGNVNRKALSFAGGNETNDSNCSSVINVSSEAETTIKKTDVSSKDPVHSNGNTLTKLQTPEKGRESPRKSQKTDDEEIDDLLDSITSMIDDKDVEVSDSSFEKAENNSDNVTDNFNNIKEEISVFNCSTLSKVEKDFDALIGKPSISRTYSTSKLSSPAVSQIDGKEDSDLVKEKGKEILNWLEDVKNAEGNEANPTEQVISSRYSNVTPSESFASSPAAYDVSTPKVSILDTVDRLRHSSLKKTKLSLSPVTRLSVINNDIEVIQQYKLNSEIPKSLRSTRKQIGNAMASLNSFSQIADETFEANDTLNHSEIAKQDELNQSKPEHFEILSLDNIKNLTAADDNPQIRASLNVIEFVSEQDADGATEDKIFEICDSDVKITDEESQTDLSGDEEELLSSDEMELDIKYEPSQASDNAKLWMQSSNTSDNFRIDNLTMEEGVTPFDDSIEIISSQESLTEDKDSAAVVPKSGSPTCDIAEEENGKVFLSQSTDHEESLLGEKDSYSNEILETQDFVDHEFDDVPATQDQINEPAPLSHFTAENTIVKQDEFNKSNSELEEAANEEKIATMVERCHSEEPQANVNADDDGNMSPDELFCDIKHKPSKHSNNVELKDDSIKMEHEIPLDDSIGSCPSTPKPKDTKDEPELLTDKESFAQTPINDITQETDEKDSLADITVEANESQIAHNNDLSSPASASNLYSEVFEDEEHLEDEKDSSKMSERAAEASYLSVTQLLEVNSAPETLPTNDDQQETINIAEEEENLADEKDSSQIEEGAAEASYLSVTQLLEVNSVPESLPIIDDQQEALNIAEEEENLADEKDSSQIEEDAADVPLLSVSKLLEVNSVPESLPIIDDQQEALNIAEEEENLADEKDSSQIEEDAADVPLLSVTKLFEVSSAPESLPTNDDKHEAVNIAEEEENLADEKDYSQIEEDVAEASYLSVTKLLAVNSAPETLPTNDDQQETINIAEEEENLADEKDYSQIEEDAADVPLLSVTKLLAVNSAPETLPTNDDQHKAVNIAEEEEENLSDEKDSSQIQEDAAEASYLSVTKLLEVNSIPKTPSINDEKLETSTIAEDKEQLEDERDSSHIDEETTDQETLENNDEIQERIIFAEKADQDIEPPVTPNEELSTSHTAQADLPKQGVGESQEVKPEKGLKEELIEKPTATPKLVAVKADLLTEFKETPKRAASSRKGQAKTQEPMQVENPLEDVAANEVKETPRRAAAVRKARGKTQEPEKMANRVEDVPVAEVEETPKRSAVARKGRGKAQEPEQLENLVKDVQVDEVEETPRRAASVRKARGKTQEPEQMANPVEKVPKAEVEETPKKSAVARKGRGKAQEPEQLENLVKDVQVDEVEETPRRAASVRKARGKTQEPEQMANPVEKVPKAEVEETPKKSAVARKGRGKAQDPMQVENPLEDVAGNEVAAANEVKETPRRAASVRKARGKTQEPEQMADPVEKVLKAEVEETPRRAASVRKARGKTQEPEQMADPVETVLKAEVEETPKKAAVARKGRGKSQEPEQIGNLVEDVKETPKRAVAVRKGRGKTQEPEQMANPVEKVLKAEFKETPKKAVAVRKARGQSKERELLENPAETVPVAEVEETPKRAVAVRKGRGKTKESEQVANPVEEDNFEKPKASRKRAASKVSPANSPSDDGLATEVKETPKRAAVARKGRGKAQEPEQLENLVEDVKETPKRALAVRKGRGKTKEQKQMENLVKDDSVIEIEETPKRATAVRKGRGKTQEPEQEENTVEMPKPSRKRAKADLPESLPEESPVADIKEAPKKAAAVRKGRGKAQETKPEENENAVEEAPMPKASRKRGAAKVELPEPIPETDPVIEVKETMKKAAPVRKGRGKAQQVKSENNEEEVEEPASKRSRRAVKKAEEVVQTDPEPIHGVLKKSRSKKVVSAISEEALTPIASKKKVTIVTPATQAAQLITEKPSRLKKRLESVTEEEPVAKRPTRARR